MVIIIQMAAVASELSRARSLNPRFSHDVFLSFRGETRHNFTDFLYEGLKNAGLVVFQDKANIRSGKNVKKELEKAIKESRISVIVFSEGYASSKWCLDEVVAILECKRICGHGVLPVFFKIEPSEVRYQTGSFTKSFEKYEQEISRETDDEKKHQRIDKLSRRKTSLTEVADLSGLVLLDGSQVKFRNRILREVEDKLNRTILNVPRYQVGIHDRAQNIYQWLKIESELAKVGILVISGIGGIGKTAIAKYVYNSTFQGFESSSYIADVREITKQPNGMLRLQKQLLYDIRKGKKEIIFDVDHGTSKIEQAICNKRVLLVLDDVDKMDHIDKLLGTQTFKKGSRIIITTRNIGLLRHLKVDVHEMVKQLDDGESLELFCRHAFGQDHPFDGYIDQSRVAVEYCGGIPLAVEVLGSSLFGSTIEVWESALDKLRKFPKAKVQKILRISYESLEDEHDKELFLHVACFFVGEDLGFAVKILKVCGFKPPIGIQNLIDRCLITVDKQNKIAMHRLHQKMGRELVRLESPKEPGKRSRLWDHEESYEVLKSKKGTETIEGLILDMHMLAVCIFKESHPEYCSCHPSASNHVECQSYQKHTPLDIDAFERMDKLRLLHVNYVHLNGCYDKFPNKLRWLCWHGFPLDSLPIIIPLEHVIALDMRHSKLKKIGDIIQSFTSLKILDLSHSHGLATTPELMKFPSLERLILRDCINLVEVSESIQTLECLVLLDLEGCKNLRKLPKNLGYLKKLILSGCSNLGEFPSEPEMRELVKFCSPNGIPLEKHVTTSENMKSRNAFMRSKVPEIPWSSLPCSLESLSVANCNLSNDAFTAGNFKNLTAIEELDLSGNPFDSMPVGINNLNSLKKLHLNSCKRLQQVLDLPSTVVVLDVGGCLSLEKITYFSDGLNTCKMIRTNCDKLVEVTEVQRQPTGRIKMKSHC